ncbi:PD-(D/E)XK nuclease family protein [Candidatus Woesearchaeota archaeon]|nr:PD-(D/E)XK nuclease family protein [Candidatus Woesearchaeota archaeon]
MRRGNGGNRMQQRVGQYKLSPSSLSLMEECARCFWLERRGVWQRPRGKFPSLSSGIDGILKKHFDSFMERGEIPPELSRTECAEGYRLFDDKEKLRVWRDNRRGIRWANERGHTLCGAIDELLVHRSKLVVLDYKTRGYKLKDNTADYYQNQLDTYNFLFRKNGYETENHSFLLFHVPKTVTQTGEFLFDTYLVKRPVDVANAERLFNEGIGILEGDCQKNIVIGVLACKGV